MPRSRKPARQPRRGPPIAPATGGTQLGARSLWPAFLLVSAGLVAYFNALAAPFVMDDRGTIVDNPSIRQLWPLTEVLSAPPQSAVAGRPIVNLSLAINYAAGGLAPWGYHAWNLGVHVLAALILFAIVRRTWAGKAGRAGGAGREAGRAEGVGSCPSCLVIALVWLVHPLQTEVIDYVTQRTESMMGLFYLLTLYAAIRAMTADRGRARVWYATAIAACALGMATKESMVTAPLMVLVYDAVFQAGGVRRALRERPRFYAGLAATWAILIALVASGPRSHSAGLSSGVTPWTYLLNQTVMLVTYLKLVFWPRGLVLDYGVTHAIAFGQALPCAIFVVALLAIVLAAWRTRPALAFLGLWFFVTLAPTSSIVPIATEVGAERRMYLPLAAIVVLLVIGARRLMDARMATLAAAGVLCGLIALTIGRNAEYRSEAGIWNTVLERRPHGRAHYNLGVVLAEEGRRAEAIEHYQQAITDAPEAHYALGFELDADGKTGEAIRHLRDYVRLLPDDINSIRAYALLGRALAREGRLDEATTAFREALRRQPRNVDARGGLADALLGQERFDDAEREYRQYLRAMPASAVAHHNLGLALVGAGRVKEAVDQFREALRIQPDFEEARHNLAVALESLTPTPNR